MTITAAIVKHNIIYDGTNVFVYHANKGEGIPKHIHTYSHATICMTGSCKLTQEGTSVITTKNSEPVDLVGGKYHEIEAMEDGTVFINVFNESKQS
jgi:quercetin dioxygenase-like cupin family protein